MPRTPTRARSGELRVVVLAIAFDFIFAGTRTIRSAAIAERHSMYVEAARASGAGWLRIVTVHILPNVMAYIIVSISVTLGLAILLEASLSFLGYGVPPGTPPGAPISPARTVSSSSGRRGWRSPPAARSA